MAERIAIYTGNFDPPHKGHMDLVRRALETGAFDRVLIKVVPNPSKVRLLTPENSVAMLKKVLPADIASRVIIDETDLSVGKLSRKFNATIVRGWRKAEHPGKDIVSEIGIVAYLAGNGIAHLHAPIRVKWLQNAEEAQSLSSTKVRRILFSNDCSQEKLEALLPADAARLLIEARNQCPQPFSQEASADFNVALSALLKKPQKRSVPRKQPRF